MFEATKDGVNVTGQIKATSGYIGSADNGFTITESAIYNQLSELKGTVNGVYIGADGIALGGGKFRVNSYGQLYATDGTFTGNVYANKIQTGTQNGENAGYITGGQIGGGTITTGNTNRWINTGLANAYDFADFITGNLGASYATVNNLKTQLTFKFKDYSVAWKYAKLGDGTYAWILARG